MVTPQDKSPRRADKILKDLFPSLTGRHVEEALESSLVTHGGKKIKKGTYLLAKDLDTRELIRHLEHLKKGNQSLELKVINETIDEWVVDKPVGMASQPLSLFDFDTPTHWAFAKDSNLSNEFSETQPTLTPHRLDKGTSGLLIVCRNKLAFQKWRSAFEKKEVKKKYLAWCYGTVVSDELEVIDPIGHHPSDVRKMVIVSDPKDKFRPPVLEAVTRAKLRKREGDLSLWEIECATGVTHQVRVHMASKGLTLVGDPLYSSQTEGQGTTSGSHSLRAYEICWNDKRFSLDTTDFEKGP